MCEVTKYYNKFCTADSVRLQRCEIVISWSKCVLIRLSYTVYTLPVDTPILLLCTAWLFFGHVLYIGYMLPATIFHMKILILYPGNTSELCLYIFLHWSNVITFEVEELAQGLRALTALLLDLNQVLNSHVLLLTMIHNFSSKGSIVLSWLPTALTLVGTHSHIHTQIIKF